MCRKFDCILYIEGKSLTIPLTIEKKLLPANTGKYVTGNARLLYMHGSPLCKAIQN